MSKKKGKPDTEAVEQLNTIFRVAEVKRASEHFTQSDIRSAVETFQISNNLNISTTAQRLGMPQSYLSEFLSCKRELGTDTLKSLGLVKEVTYKRWR